MKTIALYKSNLGSKFKENVIVVFHAHLRQKNQLIYRYVKPRQNWAAIRSVLYTYLRIHVTSENASFCDNLWSVTSTCIWEWELAACRSGHLAMYLHICQCSCFVHLNKVEFVFLNCLFSYSAILSSRKCGVSIPSFSLLKLIYRNTCMFSLHWCLLGLPVWLNADRFDWLIDCNSMLFNHK